MDDHVQPFCAKITYHVLLLLEKVLSVVFPSEVINLCLEVHVVSLMALVAKSEIHSRGENQELKRRPNGVSRRTSEEFTLTS